MSKEVHTDWHLIEYNIPIQEFSNAENDFLIKGTAISETTTHNGHKYVAEELEKAAPSLVGRPLLVDHKNEIESIKGRVMSSKFDQMTHNILFEAKIMDPKIKEMVQDGRINSVSVGAFAEDLVKEEDGSFLAKGIRFAELSLVAVPADSNATFAMALDNSYQIKESLEIDEADMKCPECGKMIPENKMKAHMSSMHGKESYIYRSERRLKMTDENIQEVEELKTKLQEMDSIKSELAVLKAEKRKALEESYKSLCKEKNVKEKDVSKVTEETLSFLIEQIKEIEVAKIEEKKEMKSVVTQPEMSENVDSFVMERSSKGYSLFAMPDSKGRIKTW